MAYKRKIEPSFKAPYEHIFEAFGSKWSARIIGLLHNEFPLRYREIRKRLPGLTDPVLSNCLKTLEKEDLIIRNQYNEIPVRVEYSLTKKGWEFVSLCQIVCVWADRYYITDPDEINNFCYCSNCILNNSSDEYLYETISNISPELTARLKQAFTLRSKGIPSQNEKGENNHADSK